MASAAVRVGGGSLRYERERGEGSRPRQLERGRGGRPPRGSAHGKRRGEIRHMRPYSVGNYCCDGDGTMMTEAKVLLISPTPLPTPPLFGGGEESMCIFVVQEPITSHIIFTFFL
uniref:Uncharacterized protein n=1 Tax=Oryza barthii TaxID=65489 RepID=A0A0D3GSB8_9ORYZ